jgi:hypothetical protein
MAVAVAALVTDLQLVSVVTVAAATVPTMAMMETQASMVLVAVAVVLGLMVHRLAVADTAVLALSLCGIQCRLLQLILFYQLFPAQRVQVLR